MQNWTVFGAQLYALWGFLKVNIQDGLSFFFFFFFFFFWGGGGPKISIFWGMPDIPDILVVNSRCWVQVYVRESAAKP